VFGPASNGQYSDGHEGVLYPKGGLNSFPESLLSASIQIASQRDTQRTSQTRSVSCVVDVEMEIGICDRHNFVDFLNK
jgi:hypothetical protein